MVKPVATATAERYQQRAEHTVLVLQGGGALGAYQAGVYEGLTEVGFAPDWVTGVSIGAINAALIAGNPPETRIAKLREFWERVSAGMPLIAPAAFDSMRRTLNMFSASSSATFGVPGFYFPRMSLPFFAAEGTASALSFYDTTPLRNTLLELVDFDRINAGTMRFAVGAVHVRSGNSIYFDNFTPDMVIGPEHVMASGALPPSFAPVTIKGEAYWDGGIVCNTPLWYVLDDDPHLRALILQVDLFSARGEMPVNMDEVLERQKDIQYSSKTRMNTNRVQDLEALRESLARVLERLPAKLKSDPDVKALARVAEGRRVSVVQLINRRLEHSSQFKDNEFSRTTVHALWASGRDAVRQTAVHPDWRKACAARRGLHAYDLIR